MTAGVYAVMKAEDGIDIEFVISSTWEGPVPEEMLALKAEIEGALPVIRAVFSDQQLTYHFRRLFSLAQMGLAAGRVVEAKHALEDLKREILMIKAKPIKSRHLRTLGKWAVLFGGFSSLLGTLTFLSAGNAFIANCFYIFTGTMAGVWVSFGIRKKTITFEQLAQIEEDQMDPPLRLIFTGILAITFGLFFHFDLVEITIGSWSTKELSTSPGSALLLGILCGIGEQSLPNAIAGKSEALFQTSK